MPDPDLIELFVAPLEAMEARYLVTGSVAATLYGEPRATHDIDLVLWIASEQVVALESAFPTDAFYLPPREVLRTQAERSSHGHFNVIHHRSGLKADFYLASDDELHPWAFERARSYTLEGLTVRLAPPEYVIVRKLEFYREGLSEKHLRDIRSMLRVSEEMIDRDALRVWIERRGLEAEWTEL